MGGQLFCSWGSRLPRENEGKAGGRKGKTDLRRCVIGDS